MTTRSEQLENLGSIESLHPSGPEHGSQTQNRLSDTTAASAPVQSQKTPSLQAKRGAWDRFINSEIGRFVCSVIFFVVVCIFMAFCNQFSDHRWITTEYRYIYLRDRGFDIFPSTGTITPANIFVMTSVVFTLIGMAFICPTWTTRLIVLRRVLWCIGTLSVYRTLTLSVTTLPTPREHCDPADKTGFWDMLWIAIQMIPGTVQACTDDIFSGHSTFMMTCAIQWRLYCKNKWVTYFSYAYITVGLYYVVATRLHYTVDVVLAIFITYAVWSIYMSMIDVIMEKEYFGLDRHNEKYAIFDQILDAETNASESLHSSQHDEEKGASNASEATTAGSKWATRRAQLNYRMNRMRGSGIGYDRREHDRVAFVPMQYNTWLTGIVRWCDGLDIRMKNSAALTAAQGHAPKWDQLVMDRRSHASTVESTQFGDQPQDFTRSPASSAKPETRQEMQEVNHTRDATSGPINLENIHVAAPLNEPK
ncbi:hypothetical protein BGW38_006179 [Lunasporangiospora selenospora]|uniref:Sphingomyelin synthase-like domain-containing protein n=1 Tax=Lunasporangiospora selenospora TaxID=979761 RepID=A0A9P6FP08_9FUNG|nr:hypothetical protein BGW38_006179 [Lunasporangiospora selenospora]